MDWNNLLNQLYWHIEHGEHAKAIVRLRELKINAWKDGVTSAALFVGSENTEQREELAKALLELRDKTPEEYLVY